MSKEYFIMDGRARFNTDDAVVCEVCESLEEAKANCPDYGDAVVIDSETMEVVYDSEENEESNQTSTN